MTKEELFHLIWSSTDWDKKNENQEWNQWRQENPQESIDLTGTNLLGRDFTKINFEKVNLSRAVLSGVNLKGGNLKGANLSSIHLQGADLTGSDFSEANLEGAHLSDALFTDVKNLTVEQLCQCKELHNIEGISKEILEKVKEKAPQLMEWWKEE